MFEIGYAIGLGLPVMPIRDTSYVRDSKVFDELGLLDTLGYIDYANSTALAEAVGDRIGDVSPFQNYPALNSEQPLYLVRSRIQSEGMIKLMSVLKKSGLFFGLLTREKHLVSLCMKPTRRFAHLMAQSHTWLILIELVPLLTMLGVHFWQGWRWLWKNTR